MDMPLLGLGTWKMGGGYERDERNKHSEVESIRYALSLGYKLIDTAELYGMGTSEEIVGAAIRDASREKLYIVSKVWKEHLRREDTLHAAEKSLLRLGTPYLDLYLIHGPNPAVPVFETLSAMEKLLNEGKIHAIGVSNFDVPQLEEAMATNVPITANQIEYNIINREAEKDVIPYCKAHGIQVMAYRPLGRGNISSAPAALFDIAKNRGATPSQIALSFILSQGITTIPKASKHEHLKENWESQNFPLSEGEIELLKDH